MWWTVDNGNGCLYTEIYLENVTITHQRRFNQHSVVHATVIDHFLLSISPVFPSPTELFFPWIAASVCCLRHGKCRTASSFCTLGILVRTFSLHLVFFHSNYFSVCRQNRSRNSSANLFASSPQSFQRCYATSSLGSPSVNSSSECEFFDRSIQCFDCQFVYQFELQTSWNAKTSPKYLLKYSLMKSNKF